MKIEYAKSAFSIPKSLFDEAKQAAKDRGMNYSEFIVKCIESVLHGQPVESGREPGIPSSMVSEISELRTVVETMSTRIQALEAGTITRTPEPIPEIPAGPAPTPRTITGDQALLPTEEETPVIPPVIPDTATRPVNAKATQPTIKLTEKIMSEMRAKIKELYEVRGLNYPTIHQMTGHPTSAYSWITEIINGKKKSIYVSTYEALMSL